MNMAERPVKRTSPSASRIPKDEADAAGAVKAAKAADAPEAVVEPMTVASITDYPAALTFLHQRVDLERVRQTSDVRPSYKLDRMRAICKALGNPERTLRAVHIAGTKGKGSTCEMTAAMLVGCGYAVGVYTSPHLIDIRERIRINGKLITKQTFVDTLRTVAGASASVEATMGPATFFELTTAMAFVHFMEEAVDVAVIEVGLGGLLDCTNVLEPEVAAVTMIGYDHMAILGNTLDKIAAQKAGIFKRDSANITFRQDAVIMEVFEKSARDAGSPLVVVGSAAGDAVRWTAKMESVGKRGIQPHIDIKTRHFEFEQLVPPLVGEHQAANCALAIAIVDELVHRGLACRPDKVLDGLEATRLAGRFELVSTSPRIVLDGAHTPESITALMKTCAATLSYDSLVAVFGCADDKDKAGMIRALAAGADKVVFTKASNNPRSANPRELVRLYQKASEKLGLIEPTLPKALATAIRACNRSDVILVCGSFYLVGEAKAKLAEGSGSGKR